MVALILSLVAASGAAPRLETVADALRGSPAWTAEFEQRYLPAGFDDGTVDSGTVLLASPDRLRFEYAGAPGRVFAFDGQVARMVDPGAATCDAVRLDEARRGSLPLAVLAAPGRQEELFAQRLEGVTLVLTPHRPDPEVSELRIDIDADGLPSRFTVVDGAGNRNEFSFSRWRRAGAPEAGAFAPGLPGRPPCDPGDG